MKNCVILLLLFYTTYSFGQHQNVRIDNPDVVSSPNEPSIMINPYNTNQIMAGSNLNYYYTSNDGGYTWESYELYSAENGVWGDPCIVTDTAGSFYFMHLSNPASGSWIDRIVCQKTNDFGETWPTESYTGLNGTKAQDKEWAIVDRTSNTIYMTWTQFDDYGSSSSSDSSAIMFSKSVDGGASWSEALRINEKGGDCIDDDNTVEGAVPALGPDGEIYVAWSGPEGIVFDKSIDEGNTWLEQDIEVDPHPTGWNYDIPGINRANGLPVTACDTSHSPHRGTIYINWSDQRNGADDTDVWLAKSVDDGETWSDPKRVNDDAMGKHQFFTWMDIDQTNGILYFVFYDRRNHEGIGTDVYMAISEDGGETFTNFKVNDEAFYPTSSVFFGDYTNVSAHDNVVRPVWAEYNDGMEIHTAIVDLLAVEITEPISPAAETKVFPNPFSSSFSVKFENNKSTEVSIDLYAVNGEKVTSLMNTERIPPGERIWQFALNRMSVANGVYYLRIIQDNRTTTQKVIYQK